MSRTLLTIEDYIDRLIKFGIKHVPIDGYFGMERSVKHQCPKGHIFKQKPRKILLGAKCPDCYWWRNQINESEQAETQQDSSQNP